MKNNIVRKISPSPSAPSKSSNTSDSISLVSGRQSKELVIGFCGPIGAGIKAIRKSLERELQSLGYSVEYIHVSSLMDSLDANKKDYDNKSAYGRYIYRQEQGDRLRSLFSHQILAEAAIYEITKRKQEIKDKQKVSEDSKFSGKVAYLIDQLKNPSEVELLRLIYQNNFYLIGVLRHESERKRNLRDEGISPKEIDDLIHKDRKSALKEGQHTEKTILDADFFIKNNQSHVAEINKKTSRLLSLIHGKNGVSPTFMEKGMFSAFSASLQSACLSRQVGAAILDSHGNVIATGRNDVPKSGGGLYTYEDEDSDYRCIHKGGKCYNDAHKEKIKKGIISEVEEELKTILSKCTETEDGSLGVINKIIEGGFAERLAGRVFKNTPIGSLIEYSRSIHAEMDAITSLARSGDSSTLGKVLFTTTYPCHNCARHIVASGIKDVFYIEPYEKSLALDLHDDAINDGGHVNPSKVTFSLFEGVSPRRYQKFFFSTGDRKGERGYANEYTTKYKNHVDIQFLDSYQDFEDRIFKEYHSKLPNQE